jgi:uncharacterized protein (DUF924 family)
MNTHSNPQKSLVEIPDYKAEDILQFWFPNQADDDLATIVRQWDWWFRGGANSAIGESFLPLLERASQGELNTWSSHPRSRLALIIVLDQFPRSIYQGTASAFAQDSKACALALEGIELGYYSALETPWEKTFFFLPLGHSENLRNLDRAVQLADELVRNAPQKYCALLQFSAEQAQRHRDIIARFGRHPHRNQVLDRPSTPEELQYLAQGQVVHQRSMPPHLSRFLFRS